MYRFPLFYGFTLVELMVVVSIILLLTGFIMPNYRAGQRQFNLERSAHKLAQDLRRAQEMAMSTKEVDGLVPNGFGVHFKLATPDSYTLFANLDADHTQGPLDRVIETFDLESRVKLLNLQPAPEFSILFTPPDPTTWVFESDAAEAVIILVLQDEPGKTKTIRVNSVGLISVD